MLRQPPQYLFAQCAGLAICLCSAGIIFFAADIQTADADKNKEIKIEKLLKLIHISELEAEFNAVVKEYTDAYNKEISDYVRVNYPGIVGTKKNEVDRLVEAFWQDVRKSMSKVETLHDHLKVAYAKNFSEDELDRLIIHYSSSLGEKDARMKKSAAIEYNKLWTDQFMNQYKRRVELLFKAIALVQNVKGKPEA